MNGKIWLATMKMFWTCQIQLPVGIVYIPFVTGNNEENQPYRDFDLNQGSQDNNRIH